MQLGLQESVFRDADKGNTVAKEIHIVKKKLSTSHWDKRKKALRPSLELARTPLRAGPFCFRLCGDESFDIQTVSGYVWLARHSGAACVAPDLGAGHPGLWQMCRLQ